MAEICHTPLPTAEYRDYGDREEIELICRECDVTLHAEGYGLSGLAYLIDRLHAARHQEQGVGTNA